MKKYINTLKTKSESERKRIAFIGSIVCTSLVFGIWVYTLTSKPSDIQNVASNDSKPFALLGDAIKGTYNNITASIGNAKSISNKIQVEENTATSTEKIIPLIPVEIQTQ